MTANFLLPLVPIVLVSLDSTVARFFGLEEGGSAAEAILVLFVDIVLKIRENATNGFLHSTPC